MNPQLLPHVGVAVAPNDQAAVLNIPLLHKFQKPLASFDAYREVRVIRIQLEACLESLARELGFAVRTVKRLPPSKRPRRVCSPAWVIPDRLSPDK